MVVLVAVIRVAGIALHVVVEVVAVVKPGLAALDIEVALTHLACLAVLFPQGVVSLHDGFTKVSLKVIESGTVDLVIGRVAIGSQHTVINGLGYALQFLAQCQNVLIGTLAHRRGYSRRSRCFSRLRLLGYRGLGCR